MTIQISNTNNTNTQYQHNTNKLEISAKKKIYIYIYKVKNLFAYNKRALLLFRILLFEEEKHTVCWDHLHPLYLSIHSGLSLD